MLESWLRGALKPAVLTLNLTSVPCLPRDRGQLLTLSCSVFKMEITPSSPVEL